MQDRVSLYPGRVKLVPVAGQENTYDMVRADSPTQDGTPLNKDSLLKDTTAALFGLGADAVPDDVLTLLSRFHGGLGNEYVWAKSDDTGIAGYVNSPAPSAYPPAEPDGYTYTLLGQLANLGVKIATGNYSGAGFVGPSRPNTLTFDFEPQILLIAAKDKSQVWYFVASRNSEYSFLVYLYDGSTAQCSYSSIITWNGKTVSWYCTVDRSYQMNHERLTYNYIAIG